MHKALIAAALLAASLNSHAAQAQAQEVRTARVQTSDLDLSKAEGKRTLNWRIAKGVKEVCGTYPASNPRERMAALRCRKQARAGANAQGRVFIARAEARSRQLALAMPR